MASLSIRLLNASREPLEDAVDIMVSAVRTNNEVVREKNFDGRKKLRVNGLTAHEPYLVRAFPMRHQPVGQFVTAPPGNKPQEVVLFCPADPQRVTPRFPKYKDLARR